MNLFNLLEGENAQTTTTTNPWTSNLPLIIVLAVIVVLFIAYTFYSNKKRSKQMEEERKKRDAIQPGYKITTIGGIVGTVVEIDHEANTFVIETGTGENRSTIKFDKQAIYTFEAPISESENTATDDVFGNAGNNEENNSPAEETAPETETSETEKTDGTEGATENKE